MQITPQQAIERITATGRTRNEAGEMLNGIRDSRDDGDYITVPRGVIFYDRTADAYIFGAGNPTIRPEAFEVGQLISGITNGQPFVGTVTSRIVADHGRWGDSPVAELLSVTIATSHLVTTEHGRQVNEVTMRGEAEISTLTAVPAEASVRYSATVHFVDGNTRYNGIGDAAQTVAWLGRYGITWTPASEPVFKGRRNGVESVTVERFEV